MSEKWVKKVEEVVNQVFLSDISYFADFISVSNAKMEAWFYPDDTCKVLRNGNLENMKTKDAGAFLMEQPLEDLFK